MQGFTCIFFQMQPFEVNDFALSFTFNQQFAAFGHRQFVLSNLVALGQIRIKIIFPAKN